MSELIEKKIDELIELAKVEGDVNTQIIMLALRGSRISGDDGLLAAFVQELTKEVLLPKARKDQELGNAIRN